MAGTTETDREIMRIESVDGFVEEAERASLLIKGSAKREGVTKQFLWLIRAKHRISRCYAPSSNEVVNSVDLQTGNALVRELVIRPQELFRLTPSLEAPIEFDRFAAADANSDGVIDLEELAKVDVKVDDIAKEIQNEYPEVPIEQIEELFGGATTLGNLIYNILSSRVAAFAGAGECEHGFDFDFGLSGWG